MFTRWYIKHESEDGEVAYFGPFSKKEIGHRLRDAYGDLLSYGNDKLYPVQIGWFDARRLFPLNSREFWMQHAKDLAEDCTCGSFTYADNRIVHYADCDIVRYSPLWKD